MRGLSIASVGFLALMVAGCAKSQPPPPATSCCNRPGAAVTVYIEVDEAAGKAATANKTVYLCKDKDWVEWVASSGDLQDPKFSESPFPDPPTHDRKKVKSGKAKKHGSFPYTIQVTAGGKTIDVDPSVEVME